MAGAYSADSTVLVFKGIPFAAPPVGDLRWAPPRPPASRDDVLQATSFSDGCVQTVAGSRPPWTEEFMHQGDVSEDCLYLNVWALAERSETPRPVLMYIHGGGFREGSGSVALYDGEALAKKGLVVVTVNYRLGPFGFFAHPALTAASEHQASGNYGMLDQVAALQWIRDNIEAFGGDPGAVTIAGQSAGAMSVYLLTASPLAAGLFHRAILQSGPGGLASFGLATTAGLAAPLEEAEAQGEAYAEALGATSLDALKALSVEQITSPPEEAPAPMFRAVVDGYFLPDDVISIYDSGRQNDVPVMSGFNADEGSAFPGYNETTLETFEGTARQRYGATADTFLALYPERAENATETSKASLRHLAAVALQQMAADRAQTAETDEYLYYFERGIPWPAHPEFGAFHTAEVPYVFDNLSFLDRPWTALDHQLADVVSSYWVNFAETGNPNGESLPEWLPFEQAPEQIMVFGEQMGMRTMPEDPDRRSFFASWLGQ